MSVFYVYVGYHDCGDVNDGTILCLVYCKEKKKEDNNSIPNKDFKNQLLILKNVQIVFFIHIFEKQIRFHTCYQCITWFCYNRILLSIVEMIIIKLIIQENLICRAEINWIISKSDNVLRTEHVPLCKPRGAHFQSCTRLTQRQACHT